MARGQLQCTHGQIKPLLLRGKCLLADLPLLLTLAKLAQIFFQFLQALPPGKGLLALGKTPCQRLLRLFLLDQLLPERLLLLFWQELHARQFRLQVVQPRPLNALQLVHFHGNTAVDFRAGNLFEHRRTLIRGSL